MGGLTTSPKIMRRKKKKTFLKLKEKEMIANSLTSFRTGDIFSSFTLSDLIFWEEGYPFMADE